MARYQIDSRYYNPDSGRVHLPLEAEDTEDSRTDIIEFPDDDALHHQPSVTWKPLDMAGVEAIKKVLAAKKEAVRKWEARVKRFNGDTQAAAAEALREANQGMTLDDIETMLSAGKPMEKDKAQGVKGIEAQLGRGKRISVGGPRANDTSPLG